MHEKLSCVRFRSSDSGLSTPAIRVTYILRAFFAMPSIIISPCLSRFLCAYSASTLFLYFLFAFIRPHQMMAQQLHSQRALFSLVNYLDASAPALRDSLADLILASALRIT